MNGLILMKSFRFSVQNYTNYMVVLSNLNLGSILFLPTWAVVNFHFNDPYSKKILPTQTSVYQAYNNTLSKKMDNKAIVHDLKNNFQAHSNDIRWTWKLKNSIFLVNQISTRIIYL